ncbi:MAG: hypothetical protein CM1200mP14_18840 [Gammaproteobacteria bacterium]|nr:MAG: hypothetical protein CM1200mP14_18840 [Gammaproteobacteria bacterium]
MWMGLMDRTDKAGVQNSMPRRWPGLWSLEGLTPVFALKKMGKRIPA